MLDAAAAHINPRSVSIKIRAGSKTCEQFSQLFGEVQFGMLGLDCLAQLSNKKLAQDDKLKSIQFIPKKDLQGFCLSTTDIPPDS